MLGKSSKEVGTIETNTSFQQAVRRQAAGCSGYFDTDGHDPLLSTASNRMGGLRTRERPRKVRLDHFLVSIVLIPHR
jgi:hypothetical protein